MSTIKTEVVAIQELRPHPNADNLEIAIVGGWQACVKKGAHKAGDAVVYFEQGTTLPQDVAQKIGVENYLSKKTDIDGASVLVVHRIKLRGEPSFGLIVTPDADMNVGDNVADRYGAKKYVPPVKVTCEDALGNHALFPAYTGIENMRSYPHIIKEGEEVVCTEKIHGTNSRCGFVRADGVLEYMAGSRTMRRKRPDDAKLDQSLYWYPYALESVRALLGSLAAWASQAVIFGEVFGKKIQNYEYGQTARSFRAFDLMIDGRYVNHSQFVELCSRFDVPWVPLIYHGPFSISKIRELSNGSTLMPGGATHGREGVVVKPVEERDDPAIGRVILKYVGDDYLFGKGGKEETTDA